MSIRQNMEVSHVSQVVADNSVTIASGTLSNDIIP